MVVLTCWHGMPTMYGIGTLLGYLVLLGLSSGYVPCPYVYSLLSVQTFPVWRPWVLTSFCVMVLHIVTVYPIQALLLFTQVAAPQSFWHQDCLFICAVSLCTWPCLVIMLVCFTPGLSGWTRNSGEWSVDLPTVSSLPTEICWSFSLPAYINHSYTLSPPQLTCLMVSLCFRPQPTQLKGEGKT